MRTRGQRRGRLPPASLSLVGDAISTLADGARVTCFDGHVWQLEQPLTPEIPLHLHVVVGEYAVLIDTGLASTYPLIGQLLEVAGVRPADVRVIFNTHAHHDHIGSNRRVQQDTHALVAAANGSAGWIEDHPRQLRQFAFHHPDIYPGTPEERAAIESHRRTPSPSARTPSEPDGSHSLLRTQSTAPMAPLRDRYRDVSGNS